MAKVLAISTDLLLGSKVEATLTAAGHEVTLAPSLAETQLQSADLLVVDLDAADPESLADLDLPTLGYYSHVDVETREAAEASGVDIVVPRSRMARELPDLAAALLDA